MSQFNYFAPISKHRFWSTEQSKLASVELPT